MQGGNPKLPTNIEWGHVLAGSWVGHIGVVKEAQSHALLGLLSSINN